MIKKGFTIVEMLVVVAIVAMLLSLVLAFYTDSKKKGRDARREEDMKEIQNILNLYAVNKQTFPACGVLLDTLHPENNTYVTLDGRTDCLSGVLVGGGFASALPTDSLGGSSGVCGAAGSYVYCYVSDGLTYILRYALEGNEIQGKSAGWQTILVEH